jgi:formylglycine-generating enzyme required for sulfatase activity
VDRAERLCTEAEWTFACEGEESAPFPYGYNRDSEACVIDRAWREVDERALVPRESLRALAQIDRLWQGDTSGSHPWCRSVFGVYDMTGNVDEWTSSVRTGDRRSILKGGYWGPVRTTCRASTRSHGEGFAFYQQGFRCCQDLK